MLHSKVNILYPLRDTCEVLVALSPNNSVVTGFWLVLLWQPQYSQCVVVFEAPYEMMNTLFPTWIITEIKVYSIDVLCCNMTDIEEAPSTPMGLWYRSRYFWVEFLQSADARSLAPCPLMWQSSKCKTVSVLFMANILATAVAPSTFTRLWLKFRSSSVVFLQSAAASLL